MAKTDIVLNIIGKDKASPAFGQVSSSAGGMSAKVGKAFKIAGAAAATATVAVGAFAVSAVKSAGDLEQSIGAIDAVFKGSADQMHEWAQSAARDVGLSRNEFNELGTLIGAQLKNGGTAMEELAPKTKNLVELGADLSSMFGGTTREAVEALSSALKGERDPIEKYGVTLNQARIDAEAAALGFEKVGGSLSAEAQQAATLSLIMKQTTDAHGNFARESGTLAHQQQVLGAQFEDVKAKIGTALLPVATAFFTWMNDHAIPIAEDLANWLGEKLGPAFVAVGKFITDQVVPAAEALFAWFNDKIVPALKDALAPVLESIRKAFERVSAKVYENRESFRKVGAALKTIVEFVTEHVLPILGKLASFLIDDLAKQLDHIISAFDAVVDVIDSAIRAVKSLVSWLGKIKVPDALGKIGDLAGGAVGWIPGLAHGGTVSEGGFRRVGEYGPEVVYLPGGSTVFPNGSEPAVVAQGGGGGGLTQIQILMDGKVIEQALVGHQRRTGQPIQIKVA